MDNNNNDKVIMISQKKLIIGVVSVIAVIAIIAAIALSTMGVGASGNTNNRGIGLEKSVAVALADAGYQQNQVTDLRSNFDKEDGVDVYEIEFTAGNYEYEYTVKAADGSILESEIKTPDGKLLDLPENGDIGLEKAKSIALAHAEVKAGDVEFSKTKKDFDDGMAIYELEFFKKTSSKITEYDYEIHVATGEVIKFSKEVKNITTNQGNTTGTTQKPSGSTSSGSQNSGSTGSNSGSNQPSSNYIGVDKAKSIALKNAGVSSSAATFTKAKLDRDDGVYEYEIEFIANGMEYEYNIDATTGDILDWECDQMDDDDWDDD